MRIRVLVLVAFLAACGGGHTAVPPTCGDGKVDPGEDCDGGANCKPDCTFACVNAATDCPAAPLCQTTSCTADHQCAMVPDPSMSGMSCGQGQVCANGECIATSCGNGVTEFGEDCDFGADNGMGLGCNTNCTFSCTMAPDSCSDGDPCNGVETCGVVTDNGREGRLCQAGSALADGASCGAGKICKAGACSAGVCGDGFTTAPEECDDANQIAGDGCENNCTFSCVSTDATRDCTPTDRCAGQGTCNDATHVCSPGTPLDDHSACGTGGYCKQGVCTQPVCGNGVVEPGEACDDGAANGTSGDGCRSTCQYVCVNAATDCPAAPACEKEQCTAQHTCQAIADGSQNGMTCGTNLVCNNGACIGTGATCGNGVVEAGEQCDFGAGNGAGTGCETNCQYSCTILPNSCDDGNPCNGTETCGAVTVQGKTGQKCYAGTAAPNGTACGSGRICLSSQCRTSTCGDGYIDASAGENCEPPNVGTCDSKCHNIQCGDGILAGTEQCDDGNLTNLDGCSATCKFEQSQRINYEAVAFTTDAYCPKNALGTAIVGGYAQGQINTALSNGIADGSISIILVALGLDDLSGTSDAAMQMGWVTGTPATSTNTTYNGTADNDWWYAIDATTIDATRTPTDLMPGSFAAKVFNGGPSEITMTVNFAGVAVTMDLFGTKVRANVSAATTPRASTDGQTPGHLASEHLDPALASFPSMTGGELCGNTTALSFANVLVPSVLVGTTCNQHYTTANTLLDVYISGCTAIIVPEIKATQPDISRDGATYKFTADASHHVVSCTRNGAADTLDHCLANAAYTSLYKFTSDRMISK